MPAESKVSICCWEEVGTGDEQHVHGAAGTGKTTLAIKFAYEAAGRKEKVLVLHVRRNAGDNEVPGGRPGKGTIWEPFINQGLICVEQVDPAEIAPGQLGARICNPWKANGTNGGTG